jgi:8-oxo-dGTP diphosphatase
MHDGAVQEEIMIVDFYGFDQIEDKNLKFAVIMAKQNGKWIFVKHKDRSTWEIPGGHREENENTLNAARRELFEETGAVKYDLKPVCVYCVKREKNEDLSYTESFGGLYYADIYELGELPQSEICEICLFNDLPENLTYATIQPYLYKKVIEFINK